MMKRALCILILLSLLAPVAQAGSLRFETASLFPIERGTEGALVERVQERLIELGFAYGLPDGVYGLQSANAVKWAQRYLNKTGSAPMKADGEVSEELYHLLMADMFPVEKKALQRMAEGDHVTRVQRRLLLLGYLDSVTGMYGSATQEAIARFQARSGMMPDGVAGPETLTTLFSSSATPAERPAHERIVYVSTAKQRVYVYRWTNQGYTQLERTFLCSTGLESTPTITGIYKTSEHCGEWYWFGAFSVWAKWAIRIRGPYLFHSTLFTYKNNSSAQQASIRALGRRASHGCIRLAVEDIKWLYDNTQTGFTTVIY